MLIKPLAHGLPDFPWDRIATAAETARAHPDGIIDLSIGTPVDPTPLVIQAALRDAANAPGYPTAAGSEELRQAWCDWAARIASVSLATLNVCPTIGSKEIVAWLPIIFGLDESSTVAFPELAYPTYAVGAMMAGAKGATYTDAASIPDETDLIWVNSPSNPTGKVLTVDELHSIVRRAREIDAVVVSDECYLELGWDVTPISILDPRVIQGDFTNVLAIHSLSKRSNLAGYRSAAVLGDANLIKDIIAARKHAGMLLSSPVQAATIAALTDSDHVVQQRELYHNRRNILRQALTDAGLTIEHSQAGLYLWTSAGTDCMELVNRLANVGILCAPGTFYGSAGAKHVRIALTATDERISKVGARLAQI